MSCERIITQSCCNNSGDRVMAGILQELSGTLTALTDAMGTASTEGIESVNTSIQQLVDCTCPALANIDSNIASLNTTVENLLTYLIVMFGGNVSAFEPSIVDGKIVYQLPSIDLSIVAGRSLYITFIGAINSAYPVYVQDKAGKLYPIYLIDGTTPLTGDFIYAGNTHIGVIIGIDDLVQEF